MKRAKTWVEVSRSALQHNIQQIKRLVTPSSVMAVVKSNAYGHGLLEVAHAVEKDADFFGVDSVDEGLSLRHKGVTKPILILGYTLHERVRDAVQGNLALTAYDAETIRCAARVTSRKHPARLHLKVETGLHRQGVDEKELVRLLRLMKRERFVELDGLSTHYANIEDTRDDGYAKQQLERFEHACETAQQMGCEPRWRHTACSAAAMLYPETRFNLVRLGIVMYGLWPSQTTMVSARSLGRRADLRPALAWKTHIAQVKRVKKGEPISYGLTERVKRDSLIAVLPVGYWDGYDRGFSRQAEVLVRGHRCRILGRVCMNMCVADVTDAPRARVEDEVVLLGKQGREEVTADELAEKIGTINYEIVTRINPQLPRIVVK